MKNEIPLLPLYLFLALHSFVITLSLQECCQATLGMQYPFFTGCLWFFAALIALFESKVNKPNAQTKNIPQKGTMQAAGKQIKQLQASEKNVRLFILRIYAKNKNVSSQRSSAFKGISYVFPYFTQIQSWMLNLQCQANPI